MGDWPVGLPDDVIDVLLVHSDCEGIIPWRFTQPLADRLTELLPKMGMMSHPMSTTMSTTERWREITIQFITGLVTAHYRREDVEFF